MKGDLCPHHEFSEEDLMHSSHINTIKSIVEKMGSDIASWSAKGLISEKVREYYESKMAVLKHKMNYIFEKVKFRKKTFWDNLNDLLLGSYYFIFNIAFYHFRNFVVPNMMNNPANSKSPFNMFSYAANFFENFMYEMNRNYAQNNDQKFNRKRA
jgi:hypothetical protein